VILFGWGDKFGTTAGFVASITRGLTLQDRHQLRNSYRSYASIENGKPLPLIALNVFTKAVTRADRLY